MIILLKIILSLLGVADIFTFLSVFNDFKKSRNQDGYDEVSIWIRLKFNLTSFFIMTALISLFVFLVYFIISNLYIK